MEFDCNNVDENEKYAFLLGSAIKNEDSDQFFSIYDSIIPKDLPDSQVEAIKSRVREIVDLPEEEFNNLVSKARDYSLASAGTSTMSCRESSDKTWSKNRILIDDDSEDEGLGSATQSQVRGTKSETSSQHSTTKCSAWSSESDAVKYEEDHNLCNSSKATNSINSLSDQDGSDCEGKGYFDYYPKIKYPPQVKIRSGFGINLDYDEAFEVKSEHSSHDDINSPRSDVSEGIEMVTMGPGSRYISVDDDDLTSNRRGTSSIDQDDFNTSGESDNEDQRRRRDYYNLGYRPLQSESRSRDSLSGYDSTSYYSNRTSSSLQYPEVDHPITFSSLKDGTSRYSRYSSYESGHSSGLTAGTKEVKLEKNSYKKEGPPFGGKEQLSKVANSIDSLITSVPDHEVKNMPEGRKLEMLTPEESKKKKKKKKKDEAGTDQNGNPINSRDIEAYKQMRESPSNSEGTTVNYQNFTQYGTVQYRPFDQSSFHKDDENASRLDRHRKNRRNKQKEVVQKSQDVQNYVGDKLPIEDLVDFIDGQNVSLKKSKKQSPSITEDIPSKSQKQNKKNKDKKQKSPTPSIDEADTKGENSAQTAKLDQQVGCNNMGNLSGKTEENASIENGDNDIGYAKKEKIPKSLLKDDIYKKLVVSDSITSNHHIPHSSSKAVHCKESVKDKEVPKTNNKRVAASDNITTESKPKKASEKANKTTKSEKSEMSASKSESSLKIDTSGSANNVKQKNNKNKKSKPTSPSAKIENELQANELLHDESLISHILDSNFDNSRFIFTDLDVPEVPKEDEFQVVGKKKKKPAKEVSQPYQQNNFINNGNKYGKRYEDKGRFNSHMNNKLPSPGSYKYSLQSDNDVRTRDLSPSAFPALCSGKGRQSYNDGRRNSTGDVQIPSDLKSQDDCDRESVKSLPATKASNTIDSVTSPRINMSYARMAAGVSSTVQKTDSIGAGNESSDPKITVWKGNARERRHSIGSSPEGVGKGANQTPSSSVSMSVKTGSQENLKEIGPSKSLVNDLVNKESAPHQWINSENSVINKSEMNDKDSLVENKTVDEIKESVKEAKVDASFIMSTHSQPLSSLRTENVRENSVVHIDHSYQAREGLSNTKVKASESEHKGHLSNQAPEKSSGLVAYKNESQKTKNGGNNNNRKHKSVIFYDKRLEETPSSLDISFGFELDSIVCKDSPTNSQFNELTNVVRPSDNLPCSKSELNFNISDQEFKNIVKTVSCASITFDNDSNLGQSSNLNVIETTSDCIKETSSGIENMNKELNADINEQTDKMPLKVVHLKNGLVSPAQGQVVVKESLQNITVGEIEHEITPPATEKVKVRDEPPKAQGSCVERIYYGENVATLKKDVLGSSSTNGPTSYCGFINFLMKTELKNNFYLAEAATYLNREWERTLNLQEKGRQKASLCGNGLNQIEMFSKVDGHSKNSFLEQTKAQREERANEKLREKSAIKIQCMYKGYRCRKEMKAVLRDEIDGLLNKPNSPDGDYTFNHRPALEVYKMVRKFLFQHRDTYDDQLENLCRYLLSTMDSEDLKISYVSISLLKDFVLPWIQQVKDILWKCVLTLKTIKPENHRDVKSMMIYLRMLITFTHTGTWKILKGKGEALTAGMNQLCNNIMGHLNNKGLYPALQILLTRGLARTKPAFTKTSLTAIMTISLRPLLGSSFSDNLLTVYVLNILSVPALVYHLSQMAPDCLTLLITNRIFKRSLDLLTHEQSTRIIFNSLEGNYALCLLANLIHLGYSELESVTIRLMEKCKVYVQNKRSNLTHWHPVLGWFSQKTDQSLHEAMPYVVKQLQILWCGKMIRILFLELIEYVDYARDQDAQKPSSHSKGILKKALDKASSKNATVKIKLESSIAQSTCLPCALYKHAMDTLSQLKLDIVSGLSYNEILLPILWRFLCDMGPNCGLKIFLDLLQTTPNSTIHPVFSLLTLFCDTAACLISTLDTVEMFEQQKIFKVEDYIKMSEFLNLFVFRILWNGYLGIQTSNTNEVFTSAHSLLRILYEIDSRRKYTPKDHWLIRDVKGSIFINELDKGRKVAQFIMQKIPHIIPFSERVKIFRKYVLKEKDVLGLTESLSATPQSTLITVHRSRIVEDGYRQLAQLSPRLIKGLIRVRFINEQGLDEAGIDQDGVFKEFLEETITKVFDPSLNLFKVTSEQKLYPSSTSYIQENHLQLFEFVGKMLAKAVYEGIIVEVPFAPFFLTQILGHSSMSAYSSLDELPSLDPDLARNLTYIKHYDGDIGDLELTFCYEEDCMGKLETNELVPGGKAVPVNTENRIRYVHLMAHFRMYRQIKEQTQAFISGFKSVVNGDWLSLFSSPELQMLISGDTADLDIGDLRKHTQYYGGYHNNHKVINWLWDILERDFNSNDRGAFLKFVTSCSKPPLLGFAHLEPPFSIRCVEVSDEQDTGDTVGSVLKGFFNIRKRDPVGRLPTSSTCFNLLKLPNYQKKSTLREKIKYAIHSNTGFELS